MSGCSLYGLVPEKPGSDNGDIAHAFFYSICSTSVLFKTCTGNAISRLENGEEVYASALLIVLAFYRDKVSLDLLFDPDLDTSDHSPLYCSRHEIHQKHDCQLTDIIRNLENSLEQIKALKAQV